MSSQEPADPTRRASSDAPSGPVPCLGGCGFYGRSETAGYCSVCYQKHSPAPASSTDDSTAAAASATSSAASGDGSSTSAMSVDGGASAMSSGTDSSTAAASTERPVQTKPHRCWECSKKIKPAGRFRCKCGYIFCGKHRYADAHSCDFDYRKDHTDRLAKSNPEVAPDKFDRI